MAKSEVSLDETYECQFCPEIYIDEYYSSIDQEEAFFLRSLHEYFSSLKQKVYEISCRHKCNKKQGVTHVREQRILLFLKNIKDIKDKDMQRIRMRIHNFQISLYLFLKDI